jgi:hypothetical protein
MTNNNNPSLTRAQIGLLNDLKTDYNRGLPYKNNSKGTSSYSDVGGDFGCTTDDGICSSGYAASNQVPPPCNCPKWVCCLLPCIQHIPSMKLFRSIQPEDAEVRRDGEWIIYDANTLFPGDIIRLHSGDRVPADCVLLSLCTTTTTTKTKQQSSSSSLVDATASAADEYIAEMVVDESLISGRKNPKAITNSQLTDENASLFELHYGSQVLHGKGIAVVTAVGTQTLLASLIRRRKWPPTTSTIISTSITTKEEDDEQAGMALVARSH